MDCGLTIKDDYEIVITQGDTLSYMIEVRNYDNDTVYGLMNMHFLCEALNLDITLDKYGISTDTFRFYVPFNQTKSWDAGVYKYNIVVNYNNSWSQFYTLINGGVLVVLPQQKIGG